LCRKNTAPWGAVEAVGQHLRRHALAVDQSELPVAALRDTPGGRR
jgi:hypothetical protein